VRQSSRPKKWSPISSALPSFCFSLRMPRSVSRRPGARRRSSRDQIRLWRVKCRAHSTGRTPLGALLDRSAGPVLLRSGPPLYWDFQRHHSAIHPGCACRSHVKFRSGLLGSRTPHAPAREKSLLEFRGVVEPDQPSLSEQIQEKSSPESDYGPSWAARCDPEGGHTESEPGLSDH